MVPRQPPQKIWHVLSNRWNSAITEYALSSALALARHSPWQGGVFTPLLHSPAEQRSRAYSLDTRPLQGFSAGQIFAFRALAAEIKPTAIIAYGGPEASLTQALPRSLRCPVWRFRGIPVQSKFQRFPRLFSFAHSHMAGIFSPNQAISDEVRATGISLPLGMIPLGLDSEKFCIHPHLPRGPQLLLVGRFDPIKGHEEFFRIFAACLKAWDFPLGPAIRPHLHIVGEAANLTSDDLRHALQRTGLRLGLDVTLSDRRVDNLPELMSSASLGVISSLGSEYICRVAEEFLLCGTPLFISGAGATKEVLFPGAGACYEGERTEAAGRSLGRRFVLAWNESDEARSLRAAEAAQRYSLVAMAEALQKMLHLPKRDSHA